MDLWKIGVRAMFAYIFLVLLTRISGKESVGQNSMFDFVFVLVMGDMIDNCIWGQTPASQFVVGVGTLLLLKLAAALGSYLSPRFDMLVEGKPVEFIRHGVPDRSGLRRLRMNLDEVAEMLRNQGVTRDEWGDVLSARVEKDGSVSVLLQPWARPAQRIDRDLVRSERE